MKKEKLDLARFSSKYPFGLRMSRKDLTAGEFGAVQGLVAEAQNIFTTYMNLQNNFDVIDDKTKNEYIVQNISGLVKLVASVYNLKYEFRHMQAANNYDSRKASPCADLLILNGHLNDYVINENDRHAIENIEKAMQKVKEQQEKFINYKFGSMEPVDEDSDLFASYVTPMLLAMYGYKVDKGFVDCLVKELTSAGEEIPQGLKNLRNGRDVKDLTAVDADRKEREKKIKNLRVAFDYLKIEEIFGQFIQMKNDKTLTRLYTAIQGFVPGIYDRADIEELDTSDEVKELISLYYMAYNELINDEDKKYIEKTYNTLSIEEKQTPEGLLKIAEYVVVKGIESFAGNKAKEEESKVEQVADENVAKVEFVPVTQVEEENNQESIEEKTENEAVAQIESNIETSRKDKEEDNNDVVSIVQTGEEDEQVEEVEPVVIEGIELGQYAEMLFLTQKDYDLMSLSGIKVESVVTVCGKAIKKETSLFGDVLGSRVVEVKDGKEGSRLKTLAETYDDIRSTYNNMDPAFKEVFLESMGYYELAKSNAMDMIENYARINDGQKILLDRLAVCDSQIRAQLENKKANFEKEQQEASIKKERDIKIAKDIMQKYNIQLPEELKDEEVEDAVASFFGSNL